MEEEEDSQADGFVVDDGYLSEGEGGPIDNDDFGAEVEGMMKKRKKKHIVRVMAYGRL